MSRQQVASRMILDATVASVDLAPSLSLTGGLTVDGQLQQTQIAKPANPPAGSMRLYPKSDGNYYKLDSAGVETQLGGGGGLTLPLTQNLTFSPDATWDIGASGASRPNNVYVAQDVMVGGNVGSASAMAGAVWAYGIYSGDSSNDVSVGGARGVTFYSAWDATWHIDASGHLWPEPDNTRDVGKPVPGVRNVYASGALKTGTKPGVPADADVNQPLDGMLRVDTTANALYFRSGGTWRQAGGGGGLTLPLGQNLTFSPDSTYNIGGSSTTLRPNHIYAGGFVVASQIDSGTVGPSTNIPLRLRSNNVQKWQLDVAGVFGPISDGAYDIGAAAANRPRDLYVANSTVIGTTYPITLLSDTVQSGINTLALRNGNNAQSLRLYNTYTDANNNSFFEINIGAGQVTVRNRNYGTGSAMPMIFDGGTNQMTFTTTSVIAFQTAAVTRWAIVQGEGGHFRPTGNATYDLGISGNQVRDLYLGRNLIFGGATTGQRILGDWSNATQVNRLLFQSSVTNAGTLVGALPNGTSTYGGYVGYASSTPTNSSFIAMYQTGSSAQLESGAYGSGVTQPMTFVVGAVERMRITTVGVTQISAAQITANIAPASGAGLELIYDPSSGGGTGWIQAYDRTGSAYKDIRIDARNITLFAQGGTVGLPAGTASQQLGQYNTAPTFSTTSLNVQVPTPVSLSITATTGRLLVYVSTGFSHTAGSASILYVWLQIDGGNWGVAWNGQFTGANVMLPVSFTAPVNVSAGAHTITLAIQINSAGTATISPIGSMMTIIEQRC